MTTMYTVFGTVKSEGQPDVRVDEDVDIPDAELTDGVHHVQLVTSHGDDPQDAFIRAAATTLQAAEEAYDRLFHAVKLIVPWLWGGDVPTVRVEVLDNGEEIGRIEVPMDLVGWTRKAIPNDDIEVLGIRGMVLR